MKSIQRNRKQRALLPFEYVPSGLAVLPDFGRTASFHDKDDFLIDVTFGVERCPRRHFDHIHAPQTFGAVELDIAAPSPESLPRPHRQLLHATRANPAIDWHALIFHEAVIGELGAAEIAESGVLPGFRLVPMRILDGIVHVALIQSNWRRP